MGMEIKRILVSKEEIAEICARLGRNHRGLSRQEGGTHLCTQRSFLSSWLI